MKENSMLTVLHDIRAEVYLDYLYPDKRDWKVSYKGTFYRNYTPDIMSVSEELGELELSRNGFLKSLPEGVITTDGELKGHALEKYDGLKQRLEILRDAFMPIDCFTLQQYLRAEREISELLDHKLEYILKRYFLFDIAAEQDPYVREAALLLPFVRQMRGDFTFVRNLLASLFLCEATMTVKRYSDTDTTRIWIPMVEYCLWMKGLDKEGYQKAIASTRPILTFVRDWFIPMEMRCEISVKSLRDSNTRANSNLLDYDCFTANP